MGLKSLFGSIHKSVKKVAGGANKAIGGAVKGTARQVGKVMPGGGGSKKKNPIFGSASTSTSNSGGSKAKMRAY